MMKYASEGSGGLSNFICVLQVLIPRLSFFPSPTVLITPLDPGVESILTASLDPGVEGTLNTSLDPGIEEIMTTLLNTVLGRTLTATLNL
jgi:hypothetical protein